MLRPAGDRGQIGRPPISDRQIAVSREDANRSGSVASATHRCRVRETRLEEVILVNEAEYERRLTASDAELAELREQAKALEEEVISLRRRLQDAPKRVRTLEERLLETKGQLAQAVSQNEKLTYTLREAREHIAALRDEVEKLTQPPSAYGTLLGAQRRRHRRRVLRRPQDARRRAPRPRRPTT